MDYLPLALGLGTFAGLITYVEVTLRREKLSNLRARQSIIDRRLLTMKSALERIERRLDAMTVDCEVVDVEGRAVYSPTPPPCNITVNGTVDKATLAKHLDESAARFIASLPTRLDTSPAPSRQPCLDCSGVDKHITDCALSMNHLVESPTDAAARRKAE